MEEKKSYRADLEHKRTTGFLLGLVFSLSVFVVMIEYSTVSTETEASEDITEDIVQDLEFATDNSRNDMVAISTTTPEKATRVLAAENVAEDDAEDKDDIEANGNVAEHPKDIEDAELKTEVPQATATESDNVINFRVVERLPEYPGGMTAFMKWLNTHLKYPYTAQRNKKQGKVVVSFIINKDGSITDIKLVKGIDTNLDREALRVMRMMPKWKAGEDRGKPCRTLFCIPIIFKL